MRRISEQTWWLIAVFFVSVLAGVATYCFAQPGGTLGPTGRRYYFENGPQVRLTDGGTSARNAPQARANLDVPGRRDDETITGAWSFTGGTTMSGGVIITDGVIYDPLLRVKDSQFFVKDDADTTKKLQFQASSIGTGTTRTWTVQNSSGTVALLEAAQTFTTDQVIEGASTGLTISTRDPIGTSLFVQEGPDFVGVMIQASRNTATGGAPGMQLDAAGNLVLQDSTGSAVILTPYGLTNFRTFSFQDRAGTLALTSDNFASSKTVYDPLLRVKDSEFFVKDNSDTTKKLQVQASGIATGTTRTLTAQDANYTLAGTNVRQTFTQPLLMQPDADSLALTLRANAGGVANLLEQYDAADNLYWVIGGGGNTQYLSGALSIAESGAAPRGDGGSQYVALASAVLSGNRTATFPNASITVAGEANIATFTNKTIAGTSNTVTTARYAVNATAQTASIGTTNIHAGPTAGMYEIAYVLECTTADVTAGTVTVTFGWTDDVGATTTTSASLPLAVTGRLVTAPINVYVASGALTYATTVVTAGTSQYALRVRVTAL